MGYIIKMSEQELNNLKVFLERVTLSGKEVMAYSLILKAIQEAKKVEEVKKVGD